jgi:hypothetical protein
MQVQRGAHKSTILQGCPHACVLGGKFVNDPGAVGIEHEQGAPHIDSRDPAMHKLIIQIH